ncbi:aminotransferase class I/II-fold pyridoxal phosphate-dependent enzyme [Novilysobacter defluvii]|nr:8-amino-7-oxononanoate synthase [Lysobacter defluvii]
MSRPGWRQRIEAARLVREATSRRRVRRLVERRRGMRFFVDGRELLNFSSNDYLGLSQHFTVASALQDGAAREGAGATAPHLECGHHAAHQALEREVADWLQVPAALLLGSGYLANLAVLQSLLGEGDACVQDRLNHASLVDGARLAGCKLRRYPHADAEGALRQLRAHTGGMAVVATDGLFGMDGDLAPLRQLAVVARVQGALLYVDDAHGVGVVGPEGRGSVAAAGLDHVAVPLQLVSLGKALGGYGAVLAGDTALVEHLAETARPYVHSTALPPALAHASLVAVRQARSQEWRRERLQGLIATFRALAGTAGLDLLPSDSPIQAVLVGADHAALAMSADLEDAGYWVGVVRAAPGQARLRVGLSALHTPAEVVGLVEAMARARDRVAAASPSPDPTIPEPA